MAIDRESFHRISRELEDAGVCLVAVSKTKPVEDILALYEMGQRDFGENYVQELVAKQPLLPADIRWHFIGHLQRNKVKSIAPFVHMIHGVDSLRLLQEIDRQAGLTGRRIDCLLQVCIAVEETKFGLDRGELDALLTETDGGSSLPNVSIRGLMGMASLVTDPQQAESEFASLHQTFDEIRSAYFPDDSGFREISMGMSGDYHSAIRQGSTMVRIGSLLFGAR
jgi:hypothetical protein